MANPIKKLIVRDPIRDQIKRIAIEARKEAEKKLGPDLSALCYEANSLLADKLKKMDLEQGYMMGSLGIEDSSEGIFM